MMQAIALGDIGSIIEARAVIGGSFPSEAVRTGRRGDLGQRL